MQNTAFGFIAVPCAPRTYAGAESARSALSRRRNAAVRPHAPMRMCAPTPETPSKAGVDSQNGTGAGLEESVPLVANLSPEEIRAAEIREKNEKLRAAEKFVQIDEGNYVCIKCGYVYEPSRGERLANIPPETRFEDLNELFVCPVCKSPKRNFRVKPKTIAGFAENQQYGFGGNSMTEGQKNLWIFGGLAFFFLLLLSGYALD